MKIAYFVSLLVSTAPTYTEGFSLALLEAGIMGDSVVCSNMSSFNISFSSKEVSFFELDSTATLGKTLDKDYLLKEQKKENFKNLIKTKYSEDIMFEKYLQLYKNSLEKNNI